MTSQSPGRATSQGPESETPDEHDDAQPPVGASLIGDRVIACSWIAVAVALLVLALNFPAPGQLEDPGTAALPQLIGAGLLGLSLLLFFKPEANSFLPGRGSRLRTFAMMAAGVVYALAVEPLGFVTATVAFAVVGLLVMGVRKLSQLVVVPLVVSLAVYYLFTAALGVYLPSGIIEGVLP